MGVRRFHVLDVRDRVVEELIGATAKTICPASDQNARGQMTTGQRPDDTQSAAPCELGSVGHMYIQLFYDSVRACARATASERRGSHFTRSRRLHDVSLSVNPQLIGHDFSDHTVT